MMRSTDYRAEIRGLLGPNNTSATVISAGLMPIQYYILNRHGFKCRCKGSRLLVAAPRNSHCMIR